MATTNVTIRMDKELKKEADQVFNEMGMNLSTAFNVFVRQTVRERAIPFQIHLDQPNQETIKALQEAERLAQDPSAPSYNSAQEAFAAALHEED